MGNVRVPHLAAVVLGLLCLAPASPALAPVARPLLRVGAEQVAGNSFAIQFDAPADAQYRVLSEWDHQAWRWRVAAYRAESGHLLTRAPGRYTYQVTFLKSFSGPGPNLLGRTAPATVTVRPPQPSWISVPEEPLSDGYSLQWVGTPYASVYELEESSTSAFSGPYRGTWVASPAENVRAHAPGTFYYRVRSWSARFEAGGLASAWSAVAQVRVLSDEDFLDLIERRALDYFLQEASPRIHIPKDRASDVRAITRPVYSIAGAGFQLSALTVGVQRGWITRQLGESNARRILEAALGFEHWNGFFYHFVGEDGRRQVVPWKSEVSSIDTALFVAGALQSGSYFGGEVERLARTVYERVDWPAMHDLETGYFRMRWTPEEGLGLYYSDTSEALMLYLLAVASPTHPIPPGSVYTFERPIGSYGDSGAFVRTSGGALFVYQYPQIWFDFRGTRDALGVDWWQNSIAAARANFRYAVNHPELGTSDLVWGFTACDGPSGYKAYGALPAQYLENDGTVAPTAAGGSYPMTPHLSLPALKHFYQAFGDKLWGRYGFRDSFNLKYNWFAPDTLAIDQGALLLAIENHRSGLIWETFSLSGVPLRAFQRARFQGFAAPSALNVLEDFEDFNLWSPERTVGWWDIDGSTVYRRRTVVRATHNGSLGSMRVRYDKKDKPWSLFSMNIAPGQRLANFSRYRKISFWVYGRARLLVKLRDRSLKEQDVGIVESVEPDRWTRLELDFSHLTLNLADIENVYFFAAPGQQNVRGEFTLDTIELL